jgi:hypothetical protein
MVSVGSVLVGSSRTATVMVVTAIDGDTVTYAPVGFEGIASLIRTSPRSVIASKLAAGTLSVRVNA